MVAITEKILFLISGKSRDKISLNHFLIQLIPLSLEIFSIFQKTSIYNPGFRKLRVIELYDLINLKFLNSDTIES